MDHTETTNKFKVAANRCFATGIIILLAVATIYFAYNHLPNDPGLPSYFLFFIVLNNFLPYPSGHSLIYYTILIFTFFGAGYIYARLAHKSKNDNEAVDATILPRRLLMTGIGLALLSNSLSSLNPYLLVSPIRLILTIVGIWLSLSGLLSKRLAPAKKVEYSRTSFWMIVLALILATLSLVTLPIVTIVITWDGQKYFNQWADFAQEIPIVATYFIALIYCAGLSIACFFRKDRSGLAIGTQIITLIAVAVYTLTIGRFVVNGIYLGHQANLQEAASQKADQPRLEREAIMNEKIDFSKKVTSLLVNKDTAAINALIEPQLLADNGSTYYEQKIAHEWLPFFDNWPYQETDYFVNGDGTSITIDGKIMYNVRLIIDGSDMQHSKQWEIDTVVINGKDYLYDIRFNTNR